MSSPIPMTVIGGYLGAGKTTLVNRILARANGLRILVLVNDFGDINIDAQLIRAQGEDVIELSNGCVCCSIEGDFYAALGRVIDRNPQPDLILVEASGVSNPKRIADVARTEKGLTYNGVVTVIDTADFLRQQADPMIGQQIRQQVTESDVLYLSQKKPIPEGLNAALVSLSNAPICTSQDTEEGFLALLSTSARASATGPAGTQPVRHPQYATWSNQSETRFKLPALRSKLSSRPSGAFRLKGFLHREGGGSYAVQVVGKTVQISRGPEDLAHAGLVAIGLDDGLGQQCETWFNQ